MDDQRHAAALTDDALERDIARALAVDPSPEFLARVRTRIANEAPRQSLIAALKGCATSGKWRRASLARRSAWSAKVAGLRWPLAVASLALVIALVFLNRARAPIANAALAARAIPAEPATLPYVAAAFRRTTARPAEPSGPAEAGHHVRRSAKAFALHVADPEPLFDPRETQALRSLIAGVRNSRVDLSPLLLPGAPAPMELPPIDTIVIPRLAIDPIAPFAGAQGERP